MTTTNRQLKEPLYNDITGQQYMAVLMMMHDDDDDAVAVYTAHDPLQHLACASLVWQLIMCSINCNRCMMMIPTTGLYELIFLTYTLQILSALMIFR